MIFGSPADEFADFELPAHSFSPVADVRLLKSSGGFGRAAGPEKVSGLVDPPT